MNLSKPYTSAQVKKISSDWYDKYGHTDEVIFFAFRNLTNQGKDLRAKCKLLKSFYGVPRPDGIEIVAERIENIANLDKRLADGDLSVVNDISDKKIQEKGTRQFSFATKFCSFHQPTIYPIYDSTIYKALKKEGVSNSNFGTDFILFKKEIDDFISRNGLKDCTYKEIDHFLQKISE
ncbi:MAG: hypothetical protein LBM93_14705 [Oscillospiraceae bacterium]|jgi:hypothetical protein|nr:hypothetical protein [Oscillospiraceae bacterium]